MYRIKERYEAEIEINKSKFISIFMPFSDENDIKEILKEINKKYPKATHYCYAYVTTTKQKSSDDGEPSGTAGRPILEFLLKNKLENVLLVVVRYFGGIKLGAGGLVRAYVDSSREVFEKAKIYKLEMQEIYEIEIDYSFYDSIKDYLIKQKGSILNTEFDEKIKILYSIVKLNNKDLQEITNGRVKIVSKDQKEVYIDNW